MSTKANWARRAVKPEFLASPNFGQNTVKECLRHLFFVCVTFQKIKQQQLYIDTSRDTVPHE